MNTHKFYLIVLFISSFLVSEPTDTTLNYDRKSPGRITSSFLSTHDIDITKPPLSLLNNIVKIDFLIVATMDFNKSDIKRTKNDNIVKIYPVTDRNLINKIIFVLRNEGYYVCCDCGFPPIMFTDPCQPRYEIFRMYTENGDTLDFKRRSFSNSVYILYKEENKLTIFSKSFNQLSPASTIIDSISNSLISIIDEKEKSDNINPQRIALKKYLSSERWPNPFYPRRGCVEIEEGFRGIIILRNNKFRKAGFLRPIIKCKGQIRYLYDKHLYENDDKDRFRGTLTYNFLIDNLGKTIMCTNITDIPFNKSLAEETLEILSKIQFDIQTEKADTFEINVPFLFRYKDY